jgi:protein SCO1/2
LLFGIAGLWVVLFSVLQWGEYSLSSKPPVIEVGPTSHLPSGDLPELWEAPAFSAIDQNGQPITEKNLRGQVWVADFIFTRCTSACPLLTAKMILLQRAVRHPNIRFISFSVDPDYDTPAILKQYAATWKGDESRWLLLSTDREMLYHTAAGMKVAVLPTDDRDNPILHSSLFFLVDQQGRIRGIYDSSTDGAMRQLADDAVTLAGSKGLAPVTEIATEESPAQAGERLYVSLGCAACHNQASIAPPLAGLFGTQVTLDDGHTVLADTAYLRESILDPTAKVVAGYLRLMPSYRDHLMDAQVDQLVAYILSLSGSQTEGHAATFVSAPPPASRSIVVDPVCKMEVAVSNDTPHTQHAGETYYFCSEHCRVAFMKNPTQYTGKREQP